MMQSRTVFELSQKLYMLIYVSHFMISLIFPLSFILSNMESVGKKMVEIQKVEFLEKKVLLRVNIKSFS